MNHQTLLRTNTSIKMVIDTWPLGLGEEKNAFVINHQICENLKFHSRYDVSLLKKHSLRQSISH